MSSIVTVRQVQWIAFLSDHPCQSVIASCPVWSLPTSVQCHLWELWMELGSWSPGVLWKGKWKLEWSLEPITETLELWARKNKTKWNGQVTDWKFRSLLANYNVNLMLHSSFTGCSSSVLMCNGGFCIVVWSHCFLHCNFGNFSMATRGKLCCSFSSRVFYLGYFRVCSDLGICRYGWVWSDLGICRYGCCWGEGSFLFRGGVLSYLASTIIVGSSKWFSFSQEL